MDNRVGQTWQYGDDHIFVVVEVVKRNRASVVYKCLTTWIKPGVDIANTKVGQARPVKELAKDPWETYKVMKRLA